MKNKNVSTPIADFVEKYAEDKNVRLHMPGHKGKSFLGFEKFDITEIKGADSLYEAENIIAQSEEIATDIFGTARTLYSTEGSSQCIRAMMYLLMLNAKKGRRPVVAASRNVHKTFVFAAALLDFDVVWLWPEEDNRSICSCNISAEDVEKVVKEIEVDAVYITSPDYLGAMADIKAIADVCHKMDVVLAVDNAHGAYLHFLDEASHPIDLGADICCDSAHKTLPVLTGGAYLHISKNAPTLFVEQAKYAMSLFGSTSPSYLLMASLDICNRYLESGYKDKLGECIVKINRVKEGLIKKGWEILASDPLKITIKMPDGSRGEDVSEKLRDKGIECEYADPDYIVLMATPENDDSDLELILEAFGENTRAYTAERGVTVTKPEYAMSIREAVFSGSQKVLAEDSFGRICRVPTVSCPPAIPIVVPGEIISKETINIFNYYGIKELDVVK